MLTNCFANVASTDKTFLKYPIVLLFLAARSNCEHRILRTFRLVELMGLGLGLRLNTELVGMEDSAAM